MGDQSFMPSPKLKTKYNFWVLIVFLCILPFILFGLLPEAGWLYVVIFLAANALWMVIALVLIPPYYRSIRYTLGEEEIIVHKGILTKTVQTVPYRTVTNISLHRGPLDRWLGLGSISVETAGRSQEQGPEIKLSGLADYEGVHQQILTALRRYRARTGAAVGAEQAKEATDEVPALLRQIIAELQALREAITEED